MGKRLIIKGANFIQNAIDGIVVSVIFDKVVNYDTEAVTSIVSSIKRATLCLDIPDSFDLSKKLMINTNLVLLNSGAWFFNEQFPFTVNTNVTPYKINKPNSSEWVNFPIETNILSSYPNLKRITINLAPNPASGRTFYTKEELLNGITIAQI